MRPDLMEAQMAKVPEKKETIEKPQEAVKDLLDKVGDGDRLVSETEIKEIQNNDAEALAKTREGLPSQDTAEGERARAEKEKFLEMAKVVMEEIKQKWEKRNKAFLAILRPSKQESLSAENAIKSAELEIAGGKLPCLDTVAAKAKVDVSIPKEYPNHHAGKTSAHLHSASNF